MNFLALDTSSKACSVALRVGDDTVVRHIVEMKSHTRVLMPMIKEVLLALAIEPQDLDAVILGNGPGSFVGMRIGASVAQGIAYAANLEIVPVSSLAVIAAEALSRTSIDQVFVLQDARMGEVYYGRFERGKQDLPRIIGEESIIAVSDTPDIGASQGMAGSAWEDLPALVERHAASGGVRTGVRYPHAEQLLRLGACAYAGGCSVKPAELELTYLRHNVAEPSRVGG